MTLNETFPCFPYKSSRSNTKENSGRKNNRLETGHKEALASYLSVPMKSLPSANEVCEGYVFTCVCPQWGSAWAGTPQAGIPPWAGTPPGRYTPWQVHPPGRYTPHEQVHTPGQVHPPGSSACWEIRAKRRRYASYWNAFLLLLKIEICARLSQDGRQYFQKGTETGQPVQGTGRS